MRTRADGSRWAERVIRDGTVRFSGRRYRVAVRQQPDLNGFVEPAYDGRLDGRRALFYSYGPTFPSLADRVFLHSFGDEWPGPNCVDGYFVWTDWREVHGA